MILRNKNIHNVRKIINHAISSYEYILIIVLSMSKTFWHTSGIHNIVLLPCEECGMCDVMHAQETITWLECRSVNERNQNIQSRLLYCCIHKLFRHQKNVSSYEYPLWFVALITKWSCDRSFTKVIITIYAHLSCIHIDNYSGGKYKVSAYNLWSRVRLTKPLQNLNTCIHLW